MDLQSIRFKNVFIYEITFSKELNNHFCPPFILQTLVENALKHSSFIDKKKLSISVQITNSEDKIHFWVKNTFKPQKQHTRNGLGIALENLKNRLEILYEDKFFVELKAKEGLFVSHVSIPLNYVE